MPEITVKPISSEHVWEEFLAQRPEASFLQSWYWGVFQENLGRTIARAGFYSRDHLVGVMLSIIEPAKRGKYFAVPGGPVIDWDNQLVVKAFVEEITNQAQSTGCSFVRVRPQLEASDFSVKLFAKLGFSKSPMHLGAELTHQLDLTPPEEEILAQMRKSTRYEIKKAQKTGLNITTSTNPADIKTFYEIQLATARRQHFIPFTYEFLHEQFKTFAGQNQAMLYSAYFEKTLLAQALIIFYGQEAVYHYGASTEAGRKYPGAYLIQWAAIKEAKRRGLKRYNFWGVADDPSHRYYSLSIFKRGFGGYDFNYLHAHDFVISKPRYVINFAIENIRKKLRKL